MPLSPIDVQQKTFRVALRGYAEDEVDEFLDEIVVSIREYEQRIEELSYQVGTLEAQLVENRQTEEAMRRTLLLAERTADEITEEARREAERILSEARTEAKALSAEQTRERDSLIDELHRLREIVADVRERLTDVAGQTLDRLRPVASDINDTLDQVESGDAHDEVDDAYDEEPAPPPWAAASLEDELDSDASSDDIEDDSAENGSTWASDDNPDDADEGDIDYWTTSAPSRSRWSDEADGDGDEALPDQDAPHTDPEALAANASEAAPESADDVPAARLGEEDESDAGDYDNGFDGDADDADDEPDVGTRRRPWERFGD